MQSHKQTTIVKLYYVESQPTATSEFRIFGALQNFFFSLARSSVTADTKGIASFARMVDCATHMHSCIHYITSTTAQLSNLHLVHLLEGIIPSTLVQNQTGFGVLNPKLA